MMGKRVKDLFISALGQGGSALLTLFYLRLAVRGLSPEAYGLSSAWLGTHILLRGLLLMPLLQLLLYRFHEQEVEQQGQEFSRSIFRGLLLGFAILAGLAFLGLALFPPTAARWLLGGILVGLLGLAEGMKGYVLTHLNLREKHGTYAIAMLGDAGLRVVLLWLLLPHMGGGPATLLVVPISVSACITILVGRPLFRGRHPTTNSPSLIVLCRDHWVFIGPIVLFAVTTWVTGLSDRYFLLHWAGKAETGRYAAVYGLFATPFTLLVATVIQVFRPRLSAHAAAPGGQATYRIIYRNFFLLGLGGAIFLAAALWWGRFPLGRLMLQPEHEILFPFLPFLLSGQFCLAVGQLLEQEFYIQQRMAFIVIKQCVGFAAALGLMTVLIPSYGVQGAMIACACYYGIECISGLTLFIWHRHRPLGAPL